MRFTIVGAGGVGGYLGARLAQKGYDISFLVRGQSLKALKEGGLILHSPQDTLALGPQSASDQARLLGPADVVIVAVKTDPAAGVGVGALHELVELGHVEYR